MEKIYYIFSRIPSREGLLGPISENIVMDKASIHISEDATNSDVENGFLNLVEGLHVPVGGECYIVDSSVVTVVKATNKNYILSPDAKKKL